MSEEKIKNEEVVNNEEVMNDEELEGVAGGYAWEIQDDANRLRALGRLPNRSVSKAEVNDAMVQLGRDIGLPLGTDLKDNSKNRYYIDNEKTDRDKVWSKIYSRLGHGGY